MRSVAIWAVVGLALIFCAAMLFGCVAPSSQVHCLPLPTYSPAEQVRLAAELSTLPPGAALRRAVDDYERMRDADRACMGAKP